MFEERDTGRRGVKRRLSRHGRKYLYGIALAVLPIVTAAGIITEEMAALYATLLGAILVPWLGLVDTANNDKEREAEYWRGLDEGWQAASDEERGG